LFAFFIRRANCQGANGKKIQINKKIKRESAREDNIIGFLLTDSQVSNAKP